jgi:hypothetical protein
MRRLLGLLLVLLPFIFVGARPTTSELLAWDYAATAISFVLDQCVNTHRDCVMQVVATLDGAWRTVEVGGLYKNVSYCWRLQIQETGQFSNIVCSP